MCGHGHEVQPSLGTEIRRDEKQTMKRHKGTFVITDLQRNTAIEELPWKGQQPLLGSLTWFYSIEISPLLLESAPDINKNTK